MTRARLRDLGIGIGRFETGANNAITDVPGVLVGHSTVVRDEPRVARTGVTMVVPQDGEIWGEHVFAGYYSLNGNGEMTGTHWIEEAGLLTSPIGITNTHQVGVVRDALVEYPARGGVLGHWALPVVAETYDGWLNDIDGFHVTKEHAFEALETAASGAVLEGSVGGGTGMICHSFKGGIGTSSREVETREGPWTVGALVQANYGDREMLTIDGVPVGREIGHDVVPLARPPRPAEGSIIAVVGTDAPLIPAQCQRLARRAAVGLARVGGSGHNGSGDIFIAFATGNRVPIAPKGTVDIRMLPHGQMDPLIDGVAEAVEEAILNALCAAETVTGFKDRTVHSLPHDELQNVMRRHGRLA